MLGLGKALRLQKLFNAKSGTSVIIPMDHAVEGYYAELEDPCSLVTSMAEAGANGFLMRRGLAALTRDYFGGAGWVQRITGRSGSGPKDNQQLVVASVEQALRNGADAVAPTIFLGGDLDDQALPMFGQISDKCAELGMPLLAEVFPASGPDSVPYDGPYTVDEMRIVVRTACEEGCDLIKTWYSGDPASFRKIVDYSTVPLLVAGGPKAANERDVLETVKGAMDAGAKGAIFGRKIWQSPNPAAMVRAVCLIVYEGADVTRAMNELG